MIIKSKKEMFYLKNREIITMCIYAVVVLIFSVLGHRSAFNKILDGFINSSSNFRFFWNCFCLPLIMAIVPFIVKDIRKMLITVMSLKTAVTLIGLLFGANCNIHLPVFQDDWGVLFFIAIDIFIAVTVYNERNERMLINSAGAVVLALAAVSQLIGFIDGEFVPYYAFRSAYIVLFYHSIYSVIRHITPNYRYLPNSHEMKRIKEKISGLKTEDNKEESHMKTYKEFKTMALRPAYYNGTVFEIDVEFKDASVFGVGIEVAKAINMVVGDTVRISGKVFGEEADYEYISIYMCGDVLTDFIGKYGVNNITTDRVRMKLEQTYTVYNCNDYSFEPKEEEITAYKLIEIIND